MYTALVLSEKSHKYLVSKLHKLIPEGWEIVAHHMTVNMGSISSGPCAKDTKLLLNSLQSCVVSSWSMDERVLAVGVESTLPSNNTVKHITVAVNRAGGGKPFHSNELKDWKPIEEPFGLFGHLKEVK